jgi:L-ascorbate metabolism protein UlaG (beta-lactamase superfamily)
LTGAFPSEPAHALRGEPPASGWIERSPLWLAFRSSVLPTASAATAPPPPRADSLGSRAISVTYVGHATVLVQAGGLRILTDPNFSSRVVLPKRLVAPGIALDDLPPLDIILVSHGHLDHLDLDTHRRLPKGATVICSKNLGRLLRGAGHRNVIELSWGETHEVRGARIMALEVNHWGSRGVFRDDLGYGGFLVETTAGSVFFPGDTAYSSCFASHGQRYAIDIALLPIGAYNPFRHAHMNPEDALQAFLDLQARYLVPIHWGTFVLSLEPIEEPPRWLAALAREHGVEGRVRVLRHGATAVFAL